MRTSERNNEFERTITRRGETEIPHLIQRYCERLSCGIIIITMNLVQSIYLSYLLIAVMFMTKVFATSNDSFVDFVSIH